MICMRGAIVAMVELPCFGPPLHTDAVDLLLVRPELPLELLKHRSPVGFILCVGVLFPLRTRN